MKRICLIIVLIVISGRLKAQDTFQAISFGGGAGAATAYTGAPVQKNTSAWYADAGFYATPFININIEGQKGTLAGGPHKKNFKNFNNNYRALMVNVELQAGQFLGGQQSGLLKAASGIYIGTGYGFLNNEITNKNLLKLTVTDYVKNTIGVIPTKIGYELNLLKVNEEPALKVDFWYTFNYTIGKGLDGYYDTYSKSFNFYNYYAVGFRYAIIVRHKRIRDYNRYD